MAGKLFISYRRDDSAGYAGRVRDRLEREFGQDLLFMDVDAVPLGVNFVKVLREEVEKCDVLLAVIGPNWTTVKDERGHRRLDDPHDFVRIEIATALQRDIPVIPVLLDGAEIPRADQLPGDLQELAVRNGLYVRHASFHNDVDRLIAGLRKPLGRSGSSTGAHWIPPQTGTVRTAARTTAETTGPHEIQAPPSVAPARSPWRGRAAAIGLCAAVILCGAIYGLIKMREAAPPSAQAPPSQVAVTLPVTPGQPAPPASSPAVTPSAQTAAPSPPQIPAAPSALAASPQSASAPTPSAPLIATREHTLEPGESVKDCDGCPEMVAVPAGSFTMGSPDGEEGRFADEGPQHVVTIIRPFAAGKFEVTVDQFAAFVKETGYDPGSKCQTLEDGKSALRDDRSWRNPGYPQTGSYPVACVSWNDAKAYTAWLSKKTGKEYRLLSEAEWEYAARATTSRAPGSRYAYGDDESEMCRYGNVADRTTRQDIPGASAWAIFPCRDGYAYAAPVGSFAANAFGLYDVHGNVWEWTEDCYNGSYNNAPSDGAAWTTGDCDQRVMRGGMWGSSPVNVRLARRAKDGRDVHSQGDGFRVARTIAP